MNMIALEIDGKSRRQIQARKRRQRQRIRQRLVWLTFLLILLTAVAINAIRLKEEGGNQFLEQQADQQRAETIKIKENADLYPEELVDMLEKNVEAYDYVKDYPNREEYLGKDIDLKADYTAGEVPLLMQWDQRWGYELYGETMMGIGGCGPTCLSMAYIYLTGDTQMNPREMSAYAYENGYYTSEGTSWSLWTAGTQGLGLTGTELSLSESAMQNHLDNGEVIVCSMAPGDFTTTGHFILITGYDAGGFYVNDPNRHSNSEKRWSYDQLQNQIKCLWGIGK